LVRGWESEVSYFASGLALVGGLELAPNQCLSVDYYSPMWTLHHEEFCDIWEDLSLRLWSQQSQSFRAVRLCVEAVGVQKVGVYLDRCHWMRSDAVRLWC